MLSLFEKNEKIFNSIPEEYSQLIFNAIIARACQKGDLEAELKLYLEESDIIEILNLAGIKSASSKPTRKRKPKVDAPNLFYEKKVTAEKKLVEDDDSPFTY